MKKTTNELVDESLKKRWKPVLKKSRKDKKLALPGRFPKCPFCIDTIIGYNNPHNCGRCRLNHAICDNYGRDGLYKKYQLIISNYYDYEKGIVTIKQIIQKLKEMKT